MKNIGGIVYAEESFPIFVDRGRTSSIDSVENARRALHEAVEIKYFYQGSSTLLIGTETVQVQAGDVVVINPFEFHATLDYGVEKGQYHLIMVDLDFFSGADGEIGLRHLFFGRHTVFRSHFPQDARLCEILSRVVEEMQRGEVCYRAAVKGLMMQFFAYLLRGGVRSTDASASGADAMRYYAVIDPALCRIRDNYAERFTVEGLASLCRVSKYHFCRVFKQVTGMSAMQYLADYRLKVASAMLGNTDRSIGEIAALCGFEDESYFCRCYKKRFGVSARHGRGERDV
ncbi:MAG: AraC family transcriptional regulator [Clostridia bacterium]|nr:AraC family transcriptional regulator [Clostridia bacterium]